MNWHNLKVHLHIFGYYQKVTGVKNINLLPNREGVKSSIKSKFISGIFAIGIFLIRGPKYRIDYDNENRPKKKREYTVQQLDLAYQQGGSLGNLTKTKLSSGASKYRTIGDLWNYQGLSKYEDEFEGGMRDSFNSSVGRTCHLCNGEGCRGCSNTGMSS